MIQVTRQSFWGSTLAKTRNELSCLRPTVIWLFFRLDKPISSGTLNYYTIPERCVAGTTSQSAAAAALTERDHFEHML